mmetsp:Transcript_92484/g.160654  ORF Transcript_92484/g.160654 Transcript_92484/m.160654 type:complete len:244 (+) Transcript_92484:124-855(+)
MPRGALHALAQHLPDLKVSFSAELPPPADPSKYTGKKGPAELAEEQAAAALNPPPAGQPPAPATADETTENEPPLPEKSTKDDRWKKFQEQLKTRGVGGEVKSQRCDPARPVPTKGSQAEEPQFARPKLPLCSRDVKVCNLVFDKKEGKVVSKADMDAKKAAEDQSAGEQPPPEAEEPEAEEEGFGGDLSWPGNAIPLVLMKPTTLRCCNVKCVTEGRGRSCGARGRCEWGSVRRREVGLNFL